ncbi:MAG TPA: YkgJ family cysteine cluster protein [Kofleriaceae bacterium]
MSRLGELQAKVDAFFDRAAARHGDDMQCHTGCSDCCHVRLSVTTVEAHAIWEHLQGLSATQREVIATAATQELERSGEDVRCTALGPDGRCRIYAVRPIVCRSHGAPIRMRTNSLPVIDVQSCFRNFTHSVPDPDCVLDQETLSAMTLVVDREVGGDGERVDLAAVLVGEVGFDVDDAPADE